MRLGTVTVDCMNPEALANWWSGWLEGTVTKHSDGFFAVALANLELFFVKVPDPTPGKNKLHFDLDVEDRQQSREQMLAKGATLIADHDQNGFKWTTLADIEGNLYDIVQPNGE